MAQEKSIFLGSPDATVPENPSRLMDALLRAFSLRLEVCMPAIVMEYNRNTHLAIVQPLMNVVAQSGEQLVRDMIEVPVRRIQHGGFMLDFPVLKGDTGWVIAADRNTESALVANSGETTEDATENKGPQRPTTKHLHKYRFGFFIPDRWGNLNLDAIDGLQPAELIDHEDRTGCAVIRSMNGKTVIVLSRDGTATLTMDNGSGSVVVNANMTLNGTLTANGNVSTTGNMNITGNVTAGGDATVSGDISSSKSISAVKEITAGGDMTSDSNIVAKGDVQVSLGSTDAISLTSHVHTFDHGHKTTVNGTDYPTISLDPVATSSPVLIDTKHSAESTLTINVKVPTGNRFYNVLTDRLGPLSTGSSTDTTNVGDVTSSATATFTAKIVEKVGDVYVKKPFFRVGFYIRSTTSPGGGRWMHVGGGPVSSVTVWSGSSQTYDAHDMDGAKLRYLAIDLSAYLNRDTIAATPSMTINISDLTATSYNEVPITGSVISPSTHRLTSIIKVS